MAKYMDSENFKHFWNNILKPNLLKKVDKVSGKGLSTNDFTDTYKNAIGSLQDSVGALNTTKVDKVIGKDLSTNDFTNEYKDLIVANKDAISKLEGFIYPCTAQALEEMSQEQQAELYTQGYRAVKTENNGTVVLLGLAADGSLEWLGCNQPRENLLDNPDFSNPINQRGLTTYSGTFIYSIDRWIISGTISLQSGGIAVSPNGFFLQRMEPLINGEDYTLAVYVGNQLLVGTVTYDSVSGYPQEAESNSFGTLYIQNIEGNLCQFTVNTVAQSIISMPVLLKGAYTAKTLPPWKAPDPSTEYMKCRRYWKNFDVSGGTLVGVCFYPNAIAIIGSILNIPMRVIPTCRCIKVSSIDQITTYTPQDYQVKTDGLVWFSVANYTPISVGEYVYIFGLELSCDL